MKTVRINSKIKSQNVIYITFNDSFLEKAKKKDSEMGKDLTNQR